MKKEEKQYFLNKLLKLLEIKSISADPRYEKDMVKAADFIANELKSAGFKKVEKLGRLRPVVYGERLEARGAPTVLIYGHYDVQLPDPLDEWITPPFKPSIRGGKIFARGATDNKGQLYTHLASLHLLNKQWKGKWPINIKVMIEGEEEAGGGNIEKLLLNNPSKFKADVCLVSDSGFKDMQTPAIETVLRGILYLEMQVTANSRDLHSGIFGGAVYNPFNVISRILSTLNSEYGPKRLKRVPTNALHTSFDVHGITGGYQNKGAKTVIPHEATAKLSIRIPPNQESKNILLKVRSLIRKNSPPGVRIVLRILGRGESFSISGKSRYLKLAKESLRKTFGKKAMLSMSGGSIPVVSTIKDRLGAEVILMGYGLPDDNLHSPNEKFDLDQFYKGIECNIEFYRMLLSSLK